MLPSTGLLLLSAIFWSRIHRMDPQDHTAPDHEQILPIRASKATILRWLIERNLNVTQVLAFGIKYLDSRRRGGEHVVLAVTAQAVRAADQAVVGLLLDVELAEISTILQSSVRLNVVGDQIRTVPIVNIKSFLVRTQSNTVRPTDVIDDPDYFSAGRDVVDRLRQVVRRSFCTDLVTVGKINATLLVDH